MAFGRPTREDELKAQRYGEWVRARSPFAIASVVLGTFSLIEFGALIIFGVAGIVLGVMAFKQIDRSPELKGRSMAWIGIGLSVVSLCLAAVIYLPPR